MVLCRKNNVCPVNGRCKTGSACYMYILCIQNANEPHHLVFGPLLASQLLVTFALFVVLKPPPSLPQVSYVPPFYHCSTYWSWSCENIKKKQVLSHGFSARILVWGNPGKRLHMSDHRYCNKFCQLPLKILFSTWQPTQAPVKL